MKHEILHIKEYFPVLGENDCDATLTTYLPDNLSEINRENEKHPCLLICPGGGYGCCSQREAEPVALNFLPDGFNVFVLNYSVAPHRYPTQLREVAAAMELIYRNAETWHCDTTHIAIMGFSAGGHLAAHYSTAYSCPEIRAMFPDSKPVQASVLCYPVITADPAWAHLGSFDALTGKTSRTSEEILKFSCDKLVTIHTPPAFLWHTAADSCVPVMNSLLYAQALATHKRPFELHIYPQGEHGLSTCDNTTLDSVLPEHKYNHVWLSCAKEWLKQDRKSNSGILK